MNQPLRREKTIYILLELLFANSEIDVIIIVPKNFDGNSNQMSMDDYHFARNNVGIYLGDNKYNCIVIAILDYYIHIGKGI